MVQNDDVNKVVQDVSSKNAEDNNYRLEGVLNKIHTWGARNFGSIFIVRDKIKEILLIFHEIVLGDSTRY